MSKQTLFVRKDVRTEDGIFECPNCCRMSRVAADYAQDSYTYKLIVRTCGYCRFVYTTEDFDYRTDIRDTPPGGSSIGRVAVLF